MKIAMMTNNYKPFVAGVPISIERLADSLRLCGHRAVVFAPSYAGQKEEEDVVRYRSLLRNVAGGFSVPDCLDPAIEREFLRGDFDLIHVHHPMMAGNAARYLSRKYQVPLVFTYHTRYEQYLHYVGLSSFKSVMPAYIRSFARDCDSVIAPTPLMKEYLDGIGVKSGVRVLPTGLTGESFWPDEKNAAEIRRKYAQDDRDLFCCVARLAKEKNLDFLLRSMRLYKERGGRAFRLLLIGDGPRRRELEALAARQGLAQEIVFVGGVPNREIADYCHACDLFLFASQSETQGIVLIEAMAAKTPVLAVRATGTQDVVVNGVNGYMTDDSEAEFAAKLMDILEKKELELLTRGALDTARQYEAEEIARRAGEIYEEAIKIREEKIRAQYYHRKKRRNMLYSQG